MPETTIVSVIGMDPYELRCAVSAVNRQCNYLRTQIKRDARSGWQPEDGKLDANEVRLRTATALHAKLKALLALSNDKIQSLAKGGCHD